MCTLLPNRVFYSIQAFLMEICSSFQLFMDMNTGGNQEYQGTDEDDFFYEEIRRQILLLTADDDEDHQERAHRPGSNRVVAGVSSGVQAPGSYFTWEETEKSNSVPTWLMNLWENGNGTGVFILNIAKTRRNRPGRMNNERQGIYKAGTQQPTMSDDSEKGMYSNYFNN